MKPKPKRNLKTIATGDVLKLPNGGKIEVLQNGKRLAFVGVVPVLDTSKRLTRKPPSV